MTINVSSAGYAVGRKRINACEADAIVVYHDIPIYPFNPVSGFPSLS